MKAITTLLKYLQLLYGLIEEKRCILVYLQFCSSANTRDTTARVKKRNKLYNSETQL